MTGEAQLRRALGTETNSRSLRFLAVTESLLTDRTVDVRQVHFYEHFSGVAPLLDYLRATTPAGYAAPGVGGRAVLARRRR